MCKQIDHFPEETDYEADPSEYFLRKYIFSLYFHIRKNCDFFLFVFKATTREKKITSGISLLLLKFLFEIFSTFCSDWSTVPVAALGPCVSSASLPAFSVRLARRSPAKQLVCFYCLAVCNITCSVTVGCVPCKHSPLISALFFFVQARQRCLSNSFAC